MNEKTNKLEELTKMRLSHAQSCVKNNDYSHETTKDMYKDPTHFIYELIQNADDTEATKIHFQIKNEKITVLHNGKDFTIDDVETITSSSRSQKERAIGQFGIGFKAVFSITTCPEIHSGEFHFKIKEYDERPNYPVPYEINSHQNEGTTFIFPLNRGIHASKIVEQTDQFAEESLLFLNHIKEVKFSFPDKEKTFRVVSLSSSKKSISNEEGETTYLFFEKYIADVDRVQIAYPMEEGEIIRTKTDKIFVFFPTEEKSDLGFLVQASYQTTPTRETIRFALERNKDLTENLGELFCESLTRIKKKGLLTPTFLEKVLPLENKDYDHDHPTKMIREKLIEEIKDNPLLPQYGGGYVKASAALLASSEELRNLFSRDQLAEIGWQEMGWISENITQDRTYKLYQFLKKELEVDEIYWKSIRNKLNTNFLKQQEDDWTCKLYEALNSQNALLLALKKCPLIRLENGEHISAEEQVFLPLKDKDTKFPTVRHAVCNTGESLKFLQNLDLSEPEEVDDVIENILTKYDGKETKHSDHEYNDDINRIQEVHKTDLKESKKRELINALQEAYFVKAIDHLTNEERMAKPNEVYIPTKLLTDLFSGIGDILFVNDSHPCLKGENIRPLLSVCGATDVLRFEEIKNPEWITWEYKAELRDYTRCAEDRSTIDYIIPKLEKVLEEFQSISIDKRQERGRLLWKALNITFNRHADRFHGRYTWKFHSIRFASFPAAFVNRLRETAWIADDTGNLVKPELITFSSLDWEPKNQNLAKLLGMQPETVTREEHNKMLEKHEAELEEKNAEIAQLKEQLEDKKAKSHKPHPVPPNNWDPECSPKEAHPRKTISPSGYPSPSAPKRTSINRPPSGPSSNDEMNDEPGSFPEKNKEIGKWGEEVVYGDLCREHGEKNVIWHNESGESGKHYDISINDEIFIEVKSTEKDFTHSFHFSRLQYEEMKDKKQNYDVYVVLRCGKQEPDIVIIKSPHERLEATKYVLTLTENEIQQISDT